MQCVFSTSEVFVCKSVKLLLSNIQSQYLLMLIYFLKQCTKGDPQLLFKNAVLYKLDKIGLCNLQLFEALNIGQGKLFQPLIIWNDFLTHT